MALLDHNGESEFPYKKNTVFDAICNAIPRIAGMKIDRADRLTGRIIVKAGVTLWSWGENIPIQLIAVSDTKTKVQITSTPKTGVMFGGAMDMGKNRQNIEQILFQTSQILSQLPPELSPAPMPPPPPPTVKATSVADEIQKLKKLFDDNVLSEEEFNKLKAKLLG